MLDPGKLRECRAKAQRLEATLQVGKAGVTDAVVTELVVQLTERKLVKVKLLKGDTKADARRLAERAGAELVEVRGRTAVLFRN